MNNSGVLRQIENMPGETFFHAKTDRFFIVIFFSVSRCREQSRRQAPEIFMKKVIMK